MAIASAVFTTFCKTLSEQVVTMARFVERQDDRDTFSGDLDGAQRQAIRDALVTFRASLQAAFAQLRADISAAAPGN